MRNTVENIIKAYKIDLKEQTKKYTAKGDSNSKNLIQRDLFAIKMLETLPLDLVLIGDGTQSTDKMNIGNIVELVLNYMTADKKPLKVCKSGADYDLDFQGVEYEIKTCINGSCYNTRVQRYDFDVILVNTFGIFLIDKSQIASFENKRGVLPYKEVDGLKHFTELEELLKIF